MHIHASQPPQRWTFRCTATSAARARFRGPDLVDNAVEVPAELSLRLKLALQVVSRNQSLQCIAQHTTGMFSLIQLAAG